MSQQKIAAASAIDFLISKEKLIQLGPVEIDIQKFLNYDNDRLRNISVSAITLTTFSDYRMYASKTAYRTNVGYRVVWDGELHTESFFGGGSVSIRVGKSCQADQPMCFAIHEYPHSGFFDNQFYLRQLGVLPTKTPCIYVTWETRQAISSCMWENRGAFNQRSIWYKLREIISSTHAR